VDAALESLELRLPDFFLRSFFGEEPNVSALFELPEAALLAALSEVLRPSLFFSWIMLFVGEAPDVPMLSPGPMPPADVFVGSDAVSLLPVDELCAIAAPEPNADTRTAIKSLFISYLQSFNGIPAEKIQATHAIINSVHRSYADTC
jgi:hypothetical protein